MMQFVNKNITQNDIYEEKNLIKKKSLKKFILLENNQSHRNA